jgi:hypothetical protein
MLSLFGMGETTKNHVKAVAQQQRGGSRSSRRRKKRGRRTRKASGHLCTTGINMTKFSVFKLFFCFPSCIVLLVDPCDFSGLTC